MTSSTVFDKFRKIEHNFNKNYLIALYQISQITTNDEDSDETEREQFHIMQKAYQKWFFKLQKDPKCMDACHFFYDAVGENHELLKSWDESIWDKEGDFFSKMFDCEGINTPYIYHLLDGAEEGDDDPKENIWNALTGLYRLAVLICIYLKMPLVKEIIDMILMGNPDLNRKNIFDKIFTEFKSKRRLRKLIMKLLKSEEDSFGDIFNSLQKVIATFGGEVGGGAAGMNTNMEAAKEKMNSMMNDIMKESGVDLEGEDLTKFRTAMDSDDTKTVEEMVINTSLTIEQVASVKECYKSKGLDKMNVSKMVGNLGGTMQQMMSAINSGSEEEMKKVLDTSSMNMAGLDMKSLQSEMEGFEEEFEGSEKEIEGSEKEIEGSEKEIEGSEKEIEGSEK